MPGFRPVTIVAIATLASVAPPATAAPPHTLPVGTAVVFVADAAIDAMPREGTIVTVHLRDPLTLDGDVVAPAGSKAKLRISYVIEPNGHRGAATVHLEQFTIPAGLLPVRADRLELPIAAGDTFAATTQAEVEHIGSRFSILVPFPFPLSSEKPVPYYTATPAKTAPPRTINPPRRGQPPTPLPTASASASPETGATTAPAGSTSTTPGVGGTPVPVPTGSAPPPAPAVFGPSESASPSPSPSPSPAPSPAKSAG